MKVYTAKSSAVRAAASALGTSRKMDEVLAVADIIEVEGGWSWSKKEAPKAEKPSVTGKKWKRPGKGTLTGRVWELADECDTRKEVMKRAGEEGLNLGMVAQQYYRWTHRE
jgi:hypothetical protein